MTSMRRILTQLQTDTLMRVYMHHFHGWHLDREGLDRRSVNSLVARGILLESEAAITVTEIGVANARRFMTKWQGGRS